jgi:hypothetical protein
MQTTAENLERAQWRKRSIRRLVTVCDVGRDQRPVCVLIIGESKRWTSLLASVVADSLPGGAIRLALDELAFTHPDFQFFRMHEPGKLAAKILPPAMDLYSELLRFAVEVRTSIVIPCPMLPAERMLQHLGLFKGSGYEMVILTESDFDHQTSSDWFWGEASGLNLASHHAETRHILREMVDHAEIWRLDWEGNASLWRPHGDHPMVTPGRNAVAASPITRTVVVQDSPPPPGPIAGMEVLMDSASKLPTSFDVGSSNESEVHPETYKRRLTMLEALHSRMKNSSN